MSGPGPAPSTEQQLVADTAVRRALALHHRLGKEDHKFPEAILVSASCANWNIGFGISHETPCGEGPEGHFQSRRNYWTLDGAWAHMPWAMGGRLEHNLAFPSAALGGLGKLFQEALAIATGTCLVVVRPPRQVRRTQHRQKQVVWQTRSTPSASLSS